MLLRSGLAQPEECFHESNARPPISANRAPEALSVCHAWRSVVSSTSATIAAPHAVEPLEHANDRPVVLLAVLAIPFSIRRHDVALRADLAPQPRQQ